MARKTAVELAKAMSTEQLIAELEKTNNRLGDIREAGIKVEFLSFPHNRRLGILTSELLTRPPKLESKPVQLEAKDVAVVFPAPSECDSTKVSVDLAKPSTVELPHTIEGFYDLESVFNGFNSDNVEESRKAERYLRILREQMTNRFCSVCSKGPSALSPCYISGGLYRAMMVKKTFDPPIEVFFGSMGLGCRKFERVE